MKNTDNLGKVYLIPSTLAPETTEQVIVPIVASLIKNINFYLVENIRTARRFISSLKTGVEIENLQFEIVNKDTKKESIKDLFKPVYEGHDIAVISEAGCPGIADPGALIVDHAHKNNIQVVPIAGPSSIFMALMSSGFSGQHFAFKGYLPIDKIKQNSVILEMEKRSLYETQIFMETPYRNNQLFQNILSNCKGETDLCIACNITATDEYIKTMSIRKWKNEQIDLHKKPTIFLIGRSE